MVSKPDFIRHSGQRPWGAPGTTGFPQIEQIWVVSIIILPPIYKGKRTEGYRGNGRPAFDVERLSAETGSSSGQHGKQITQ
ncbi:MAG: hypothetical protein ACLP7I_19340, partial [Limisphaerales bacterium]